MPAAAANWFCVCLCFSLYNNITTPSCLIPGADLCLFKKGIAPKWEDEKCKKGGKWSLKVPKKQEVDNMWLNTVRVVTCGFLRTQATFLKGLSFALNSSYLR